MPPSPTTVPEPYEGAAEGGRRHGPLSLPAGQLCSFFVTLILFAILFGARHISPREKHRGLVAAIALESIVKLVAFLVVGVFVTFFIYDGLTDLGNRAMASVELRQLLTLPENTGAYSSWAAHIFLSMMAIVFLPRQFQVMVVKRSTSSGVGE